MAQDGGELSSPWGRGQKSGRVGEGIRPGCWEEREVGEQSLHCQPLELERIKVVGRCQHLVRTSTAALVPTGFVILEDPTYAHLSLTVTS